MRHKAAGVEAVGVRAAAALVVETGRLERACSSNRGRGPPSWTGRVVGEDCGCG